jgi:hypothetical protein
MTQDATNEKVQVGQSSAGDSGVDSIWGDDFNNESNGSAGQDLVGDLDERLSGEEDSSDVSDTSETEGKRSKGKLLFIIATIALLALGSAGYIVYSFFQKLNPQPTSQMEASGTAVLVDVPETAQEGTSSTGTLDPDSVNTAAPTAAPVDPQGSLPVAAPTGTQVETSPVVTDPSSASVSSGTGVPAAPPVVAAVPQSPPACVPAPQTCTLAETEKPRSAKPRPALARDQQAAKRSSSSAKADAESRTKKAQAASTQKNASAADGPSVESRSDLGRLTGYKVLAIEPRSGEHQQAWIRNPEGRMFIVRAGDSLEGARVKSVSFDLGIVTTERGVIRK